MNTAEQQFLNELDKKLWNAADRLRASMDAANYKHIILGLIFLKYVSDASEERQQELRARFLDSADDYYLPREADATDADYETAIRVLSDEFLADIRNTLTGIWRWSCWKNC